jgi:hypothetical protein
MGLERLVVHDGQRRGRGADAARAQSRSRGGWRAGPVGTAAVAHKRKRASVRMGWPGGKGSGPTHEEQCCFRIIQKKLNQFELIRSKGSLSNSKNFK